MALTDATREKYAIPSVKSICQSPPRPPGSMNHRPLMVMTRITKSKAIAASGSSERDLVVVRKDGLTVHVQCLENGRGCASDDALAQLGSPFRLDLEGGDGRTVGQMRVSIK